jgi:hypothetical protein
MKLISDAEINVIDNLWNNPQYIKKRDRSYYTLVINHDSIQPIIKKLIMWTEEQISNKIILHDNFLISHRFYKNDYFLRHSDNSYVFNKNRAYAVGFHLNNNYVGGEYMRYDLNIAIDNTPGVPYLFDSKVEHEILPIKEGIRKSVLIFINREELHNFNVKRLL